MTWTGDIVERWKEHFEELRNPTNMSSVEDSGVASPISLAEVSQVVKKLLSGKTPGLDEIHPETQKALDIA